VPKKYHPRTLPPAVAWRTPRKARGCESHRPRGGWCTRFFLPTEHVVGPPNKERIFPIPIDIVRIHFLPSEQKLGFAALVVLNHNLRSHKKSGVSPSFPKCSFFVSGKANGPISPLKKKDPRLRCIYSFKCMGFVGPILYIPKKRVREHKEDTGHVCESVIMFQFIFWNKSACSVFNPFQMYGSRHRMRPLLQDVSKGCDREPPVPWRGTRVRSLWHRYHPGDLGPPARGGGGILRRVDGRSK